MATTNPHPDDPVAKLGPKPPGAPAHDDHDVSGPPAPEVIARGYEADVYDSKSVLSVPLLVVLFFVLAFGTVTVIFRFIAYPKADPRVHPGAAERNKAPLNERLNRLGRGHEVDQARLEPLRLREGESRAITRPDLPVSEGNSPELHPEDLIPSKDRFPELYGGPNKIGLDRSMSFDNKALETLFPVQKTQDGQPAGTKPADSRHVPTGANAGRGFGESSVILPGTPTIPAPKAAPAPAPDPKNPKPEPKPDPKEPKKEEKK